MIPCRELKPADREAAIDIIAACFGETKRQAGAEDIESSLSQDSYRATTFVATDAQGQIIGMIQSISGYIAFNLRCFAWLAVLPDYRGKGIGKLLLHHAEQQAITEHFAGHAGTFMLSAQFHPPYYESVGYHSGGVTHDGNPILVKHYQPD